MQILPLGPDCRLHITRIPCDPEVTEHTLAQMEHDLPASVQLLPDVPFDVIGYGCTSGATVIGSSRIRALIRAACDTPNVSDPIASVIEAVHFLKVQSLGMVTPYIEPVSAAMRAHLQTANVRVVALESFDIIHDPDVARVTAGSIKDAAIQVGRANCDGVFVSCTNLAGLSVIAEIEDAIGKPVLTSNQALAWSMCRSADLKPRPGFGQLLSKQI